MHEIPGGGEQGADKLGADEWHLSSDSHYEQVETAEEELKQRLIAGDWPEDDIGKICSGFREILVNGIKHGNKHDPSKQVHVYLNIQKNSIAITIEDEGDGFDPVAVPNPLKEENLMRASGRGIFMAGAFFDEVAFSKGGRKVTAVKYRQLPA